MPNIDKAPVSSTAQRRLTRELLEFKKDAPTGISLNTSKMENEGNGRLDAWFVDIEGPKDSLYSGEKFELQFKFGRNFPFDSPEVTFTGPNIPVHPHVYSNGHICLSILADDWSPALTVVSVCLSLQSMLGSCTQKKPPKDDRSYVHKADESPKATSWHFHDDKV